MTPPCECGCGDPVKLDERGKPRRFLNGHQCIVRHEFDEVDLGYSSPCWIWRKGVASNGYGPKKWNGKDCRAHRVYYEQRVGPIPEGLDLDHLCRNRACVNPEHLEPVTRRENLRRSPRTRLTDADVVAFRASSEPLKARAVRFGISHGYAKDLSRRRYRADATVAVTAPKEGATNG